RTPSPAWRPGSSSAAAPTRAAGCCWSTSSPTRRSTPTGWRPSCRSSRAWARGCTSTPRSTAARSGAAVLDDWLREAAATLGMEPADAALLGEEAVTLLLDVTRDVAHGVARPAGPLSTFVLGLAVGSSGGGLDDLRRLARRLADLADTWEADPSPS